MIQTSICANHIEPARGTVVRDRTIVYGNGEHIARQSHPELGLVILQENDLVWGVEGPITKVIYCGTHQDI